MGEENHLKFGADLLGFVGNVEFRDLLGGIGFQQTCEHTNEGGFSGSILTKHDNNFRVGKISRVNLQAEIT